MSIDWFTVAAQIVNFLILVWLLKKLLFRPLMNVMERRELGINGRLQQAHRQMDEAQALKQQYQQHLQQLQEERDAKMAEARQQAEDEKTELLRRLGDDMQRKKMQFEAEMQRQQQELGESIRQMLSEKALALSDKILTELASESLEQRIIERFLEHLSSLPQDERDAFTQALRQQHQATIITGFPANEANRRRIQRWLDEFAPDCRLLFEQRDAIVCGIALEVGGRSWEWNVDRYLSELESELLTSPGKSS
ncbi:hypothetical protein Q9L42_005205 [Methylomarinum sp. Ch1-1]|uniref:ATP synthase subunit b n=1 Tax=Methylomarinum roseum TaxID=3067653 RepID=A0AAU7NX18_9GAMM|nr:hypothetical protein [Methylomarinum sp. Ch1-1]MDP4522401.1 hypothetical protein [Methylomarinum sp. Ch1-1]